MTTAKKFLSVLFTGALASTAAATDYYVAPAPTGSDEKDGTSSEAPFATIDKAIITATSSDDVIHVAPGTYSTTTQWGPNLTVKLIGTGTSRDAVVIQSAGSYRTLRMAAGSWLENVTVVGNMDITKVDKGGAIEMNGGTVTNCVVRDGTAKGNDSHNAGGNIYSSSTASLIVDCVISGGTAQRRGGNVCLDQGTLRNCTITGGSTSGGSEQNNGGNVWTYQGKIENCTLTNGQAANGGNLYLHNANAICADCKISGGTASNGGGNVYNKGRLTRCSITGGTSTAQGMGGGVRNNGSDAVLEDCLIADNVNGGLLQEGAAKIYSCTIVNNQYMGVYGYGNASKSTVWLNTIVYGNTGDSASDIRPWRGDQPNLMTACAIDSQDMAGRNTYANCVYLADSAVFSNYAGRDYTLAAKFGLIDAGTSDEREFASTTDLLGNPRLSGLVDIGCYEYQKTTMSVDIALADSAETVYAPGSVTFNVTATGYPDGQTPTFTVNFGDGSAAVETTDTQVEHEFTTAGIFTVTVQASAAGAFDAQGQLSSLQIASRTIYVNPGNVSEAFPYNTPGTGYTNIADAVSAAAEGHEIRLLPGVHEVRGQLSIGGFIVHGVSATAEESVRPEDVIVRNVVPELDGYKYRVMEVTNAAARVANLTIENGRVINQDGGNLRLAAGIVSNCVIRGGLVRRVGDVDKDINAAGGGVEIGQGTLTHCVVSNNVVEGTSFKNYFAGGAVYFTYGQKWGHVSNCLVSYNSYKPNREAYGSAGIQFGGANEYSSVENCTVVSNIVVGTLNGDSAGISCTTWTGRLRNNIVLGNYETGKEKFTAVLMDTQHGTYVGNITEAEADHVSVFRDFANGDFGIKPFSAAYGAGTIAGLVLAPSVDLAGAPRVQFDRIDAGCYECQVRRGVCFIVK